MDNENENKDNPSPAGATESETAEIINGLKAKIEELSKQNSDLLDAKSKYYDKVLNSNNPTSSEAPTHRKKEEVIAELVNYQDRKEIPTNLEYCKLIKELDDIQREETGESVFIPTGPKVGDVSPAEYAKADKFSEILADCIEESKGDPNAFNVAMARHISPAPAPKPKNRR